MLQIHVTAHRGSQSCRTFLALGNQEVEMASVDWARRILAGCCALTMAGIVLAAPDGLVTPAGARQMGGGGGHGGFAGSGGFVGARSGLRLGAPSQGAQLGHFRSFFFDSNRFNSFFFDSNRFNSDFRFSRGFNNRGNQFDSFGGGGGGWGWSDCFPNGTFPCQAGYDPRYAGGYAGDAQPPDPPPPRVRRYEPATVETTPEGVTIVRGPGSRHL
jgi:hypothetical protein